MTSLPYTNHYRPVRRRQQQPYATRISRAEAQWENQLPSLVDAYLQYMNGPPSAQELGQESLEIFYIDVFGEYSYIYSTYVHDYRLLSEFSSKRTLSHLPNCPFINSTLLRHGCLSSSPHQATYAISLRTLELYRCLRLRQPRVSIQAWIRVICDLHNVRSFTWGMSMIDLTDSQDNIPAWILESIFGHIRCLYQDSEQCAATHRCHDGQGCVLLACQTLLPVVSVQGCQCQQDVVFTANSCIIICSSAMMLNLK